MPRDLPKIIKGFRAEVCLKVIGGFLIPFGAMLVGAFRSKAAADEDGIQVLLEGVAIIGGVLWLLGLPYLLMVFTPRCDSCKVRTKRHGKLSHDGDEWKVTICPRCRERFMHRMFDP